MDAGFPPSGADASASVPGFDPVEAEVRIRQGVNHVPVSYQVAYPPVRPEKAVSAAQDEPASPVFRCRIAYLGYGVVFLQIHLHGHLLGLVPQHEPYHSIAFGKNVRARDKRDGPELRLLMTKSTPWGLQKVIPEESFEHSIYTRLRFSEQVNLIRCLKTPRT